MARQIRGYDEESAFTGWRKVMFWQRGELKKIKRRANKRERRTAKNEIRKEVDGS